LFFVHNVYISDGIGNCIGNCIGNRTDVCLDEGIGERFIFSLKVPARVAEFVFNLTAEIK